MIPYLMEFAPGHLKGNSKARTQWAVDQVKSSATTSRHLDINVMASFSGALVAFYLSATKTPRFG